MAALSSLGIGLSLVAGCLILALIAELYYLFWWKKRAASREREENYRSPARELLYFLCWRKASSLSSAALNPQEICSSANFTSGSDDVHLHSSSCKNILRPFGAEGESVDAELMRLHSLSGPPRFLFTIKEETKEDLESENGRSRKGSRGGSLSDLLFPSETPFLTPLSSPPFFTPPLTPSDCYSHHGLNPLFKPSKNDDLSIRIRSSPPPKFKFLKDAEEKLYRKTLMEEALKAHRSYLVQNVAKMENFSVPAHSPVAAAGINSCPSPSDENDGSFINIVFGKNLDKEHQHLRNSSSS
ncbi:hypothetical protein IEQ34_005505 [Dendrobium chrysotoxum]|uniref:Membrane lipoprotein n=1 Tax=Dendrobium chrysotoxum TaxID=161865 RepID=A0AAV7H8U3_DENCH|nr:hypothetical protein IEQ34_005505 [Dendrobium chrysotoxum]